LIFCSNQVTVSGPAIAIGEQCLADFDPIDGPNGIGGTVTITFGIPANYNAVDARKWLDLLEAKPFAACLKREERGERMQARQWLDFGLGIATCLFQVLRLPVFSGFHVETLKSSPQGQSGWIAVCRLSEVERLPQSVMEGVLSVSFRLGAWACNANPLLESDREIFFQTIEVEVRKAFSGSLPNGKSTFEILRVARELGIPYFAMPGGAYQVGMGRHGRRVDRSTTDRDSALGMRWSHNKAFTAELLRQVGLPAPVHFRVKTLEHARQAAERLGFPVVIKPIDLERGEGVSVNVLPATLDSAFASAHKCSPSNSVLVEQQVPGLCHRLFIVGGQLLYAVRRLPMGVYADGRSTIADLVATECEVQSRRPPWKRSGIRPLDDLAFETLAQFDLSPDSIPAAEEFIALRRIESTSWGGVDEDVSNVVHVDNVAAAVLAARCFGLEVAGVDIISTDISQPWHANGAIINEVNYAPLLGGGDISRSRIPKFLDLLLKGDGRIPVHVHVGGAQAFQAARTKWQQLVDNGVSGVLVSSDQILMPSGEPRRMPVAGIYSPPRSLVMSSDVDALVIVLQTDEYMHTGLPFDRITDVHETAEPLMSFVDGRTLGAAQEDNLRALIRRWRDYTGMT
jgi:D-alanine-D-alanine ligase-like ATP-grasp enzyme